MTDELERMRQEAAVPRVLCQSSRLVYCVCVCVLHHKHTKHKHTEGAKCRIINVQATGTHSYHWA